MKDYMKCGDGPSCIRCRHNRAVHPVGVRYLRRNALGRCDYFAEKDKSPDDQRGGPRENPEERERG